MRSKCYTDLPDQLSICSSSRAVRCSASKLRLVFPRTLCTACRLSATLQPAAGIHPSRASASSAAAAIHCRTDLSSSASLPADGVPATSQFSWRTASSLCGRYTAGIQPVPATVASAAAGWLIAGSASLPSAGARPAPAPFVWCAASNTVPRAAGCTTGSTAARRMGSQWMECARLPEPAHGTTSAPKLCD